LADTWEYDGAQWIANPVAGPPARSYHALAYDTGRARVVLFGGTDGRHLLSDTWEYDGANWSPIATISAPPARYGNRLAYDPLRGRTLLAGGQAAGPDTWEYDGRTWTLFAVAGPSPIRIWSTLAFDPRRGRAVEFGGFDPSSFTVLGDTWEYVPAAAPTWTRYGTGCAGSNGTPALDAAAGAVPALGSTFALQLTSLPVQPGLAALVFGTDLGSWLGAPLPVGLEAFGLPGCKLWIAPAPGAAVLLAHAGGAMSLPIAIPAAPALAGLVVGAQAFAFDAAAPSGIGAVSNGGVLRLN